MEPFTLTLFEISKSSSVQVRCAPKRARARNRFSPRNLALLFRAASMGPSGEISSADKSGSYVIEAADVIASARCIGQQISGFQPFHFTD